MSSSTFRVPVISRLFDLVGVVFIALGVVVMVVGFAWSMGKCGGVCIEIAATACYASTLLISGLLLEGVAEIIRATAESAFNTKLLVELKLSEMCCKRKEKEAKKASKKD